MSIKSKFSLPGGKENEIKIQTGLNNAFSPPLASSKIKIAYFDFSQTSGISAGTSTPMSFFRTTLRSNVVIQKFAVHAFRLTSAGAVASIDMIQVILSTLGNPWSTISLMPGSYSTAPSNPTLVKTGYNPSYGPWEWEGPAYVATGLQLQLTATAYANWAATDQLFGGATVWWYGA